MTRASFTDLPPFAAWRHRECRTGFEVAFLSPSLHRAEGHTAAVEGGEPWSVAYAIEFDERWMTRSVRVVKRSASGECEVRLASDGLGRWLVDGSPAPHLDGCMDVDLESSCLTNALPVHRLQLGVGQAADAPAAYIRALDPRVERLEQHYLRLEDLDGHQRYHYQAPAFGFGCGLVYDQAGLVLVYPGIGQRVA